MKGGDGKNPSSGTYCPFFFFETHEFLFYFYSNHHPNPPPSVIKANYFYFLPTRLTWIVSLHDYREQKKDSLESEALYRRDIITYEDTLEDIQEWYDEQGYY